LGIVRARSLNPRNRAEPIERKAKSAGEASLSPGTGGVNPAGTTHTASPTPTARRLRGLLRGWRTHGLARSSRHGPRRRPRR
jgi:hypothetical protein